MCLTYWSPSEARAKVSMREEALATSLKGPRRGRGLPRRAHGEHSFRPEGTRYTFKKV